VRKADDFFQVGIDFLVAENQLSAIRPLTLGADFVQEFDVARTENAVAFGPLVSFVAGDVHLDPLVFLVLLLLIEPPERNWISGYLLDATRPKLVWFYKFCKRNRLNLNCLLRQSIEQFAA
jgi:hypothetical protein